MQDATPESSETPSLGDELIHLIKVVERTAAQLSARRQDGLGRAAFTALVRLVHDGPQRARALADAVLIDPSTLSRYVAHLVQLGLVERREDPVDGRASVLAATAAGAEFATELRRRRNVMVDAVVADWPAVDRARFTELLHRFSADLERSRPVLLADSEPVPAPEGAS